MLFLFFLGALSVVSFVHAACYEPSPAFPVPSWEQGRSDLQGAFDKIQGQLDDVVAQKKYNTSSYSIEITSSAETLWQTFHTARELNSSRPGAQHVGEQSLYRIASVTKVFTTLALLYQVDAGNLSLEDPVSKYIAELSGPGAGEIPWPEITLRTLASQLSGIRRDFTSDLLDEYEDPTSIGLPPKPKVGLSSCDNHSCNRTQLLDYLKTSAPVFTPHQKSTYSNLNFELLGLVLENVTGVAYKDYIRQAIFEPLGMSSSTFDTPSDKHAVLPIGENYWGVDEGVQNPTGGIYSSSADLSKFVRYILTHFNTLGGVNWLMPASWGTGLNSFYGMPFETFRTDRILEASRRPVTFVTKGGALPGYFTLILVLEEYGLGVSLLVGGDSDLLEDIRDIVTVELVRAAEDIIWRNVRKRYTGSFAAVDHRLNSSLAISSSASKGLFVTSFISNSTDVLGLVAAGGLGPIEKPDAWHAQLVPTLLFKNETSQEGEIFRLLLVDERTEQADFGVWDTFCITDVDIISYAGLPLNEVVFWHEIGLVELPAWNLTAKLGASSSGDDQLAAHSDL